MNNLFNLFTPMYEAEGGQAGGGQSSEGDNGGQGNEPGTDPNNQQQDNSIPYDRFQDVVSQKNDYKQKYNELIEQQKEQQRQAQEKQGEYESLYNDLKAKYDPLAEELEQYKKTFQTILKSKLESVPKDMRDLIPEGNELEQLKWIENANNKGLFTKQKAQDFGNKGSNPAGKDNQVTQKEFDNMGYMERAKIKKSDPTLYKKLSNR